MKNLVFGLFLILFISACKKDKGALPVAADQDKGKVELIFMSVTGSDNLFMDSIYTSGAGEQYRLTKLKFFVSDIGFAAGNSTEEAAEDSSGRNIFLVNFTSLPNSEKLYFDVKPGEYKGLRFNIGLPRDVNHADPTVALRPLNLAQSDMYWSWNSGYIFFLAEGNGPNVYQNKFHFGIGEDKRIMPFSFGNVLSPKTSFKIEKGKTTRVVLKFDFQKILVNGDGSFYSLAKQSSTMVHGGYFADLLSANISNTIELVSSEIID
ncbi:MbnP family protein [Sporocytophaga myxococcoides]|uniref:MbnP family protein n=1 Tax=Sporocytophaga myxococcoides TaxID=153721 RepID=UPI000405C0E6|nr:MbnP family protein [Sporocytophaga myxococcoides]